MPKVAPKLYGPFRLSSASLRNLDCFGAPGLSRGSLRFSCRRRQRPDRPWRRKNCQLLPPTWTVRVFHESRSGKYSSRSDLDSTAHTAPPRGHAAYMWVHLLGADAENGRHKGSTTRSLDLCTPEGAPNPAPSGFGSNRSNRRCREHMHVGSRRRTSANRKDLYAYLRPGG